MNVGAGQRRRLKRKLPMRQFDRLVYQSANAGSRCRRGDCGGYGGVARHAGADPAVAAAGPAGPAERALAARQPDAARRRHRGDRDGRRCRALFAALGRPRPIRLSSPRRPRDSPSYRGSTIWATCPPRCACCASRGGAGRPAGPAANAGVPRLAAAGARPRRRGALWLWFTNLFNFMDGMDGLAGSEAASFGSACAARRLRHRAARRRDIRCRNRLSRVELGAGAHLSRRCRQRAARLSARLFAAAAAAEGIGRRR